MEDNEKTKDELAEQFKDSYNAMMGNKTADLTDENIEDSIKYLKVELIRYHAYLCAMRDLQHRRKLRKV